MLQEFDLEIIDKSWAENVVVDHLSRLVTEQSKLESENYINEEFPDEKLFEMHSLPWFADIANYLAKGIVNSELTPQEKKRFLHVCSYYLWDEQYLFKIGQDEVLRRCIPEEG